MELLATNDAGRVLQFDSHFSIMQDGIRKEIGKYFIDISKLVFGGSVLASIMNIEDISRIWIFSLGTFATILFAIFSFLMMYNKIMYGNNLFFRFFVRGRISTCAMGIID